MQKKLFIVVNVDWFMLSHRLPVAIAARDAGYRVTVVAKDTGRREEIESHGLEFIDMPFQRSGTNPFHEFTCIYRLKRLYRKHNPDVIHLVTLKASMLGCLAAKWNRSRNVVNAISGFGYNFTGERTGLKQRVIKSIMKAAFNSRYFNYIFQNPDDINMFFNLGFAAGEQIHLIKGSGVDLTEYAFVPEMRKEKVRVLLPARMLYDKGIVEFINAAKRLSEEIPGKAEFVLAGDCDADNLAGIPEKYLKKIIEDTDIRWAGFQKDIYSALKDADIVVLPSYREGLPKALIDACAVGRPIVTTDAIGCRECVVDNWNGYLVPVKNSEELGAKIKYLIINPEERERMGKNSRLLAEKDFSVNTVIDRHLDIYRIMEGLK